MGMLRESQVEILGKFMKNTMDRASLCHQMIMGAGKTTVIAPLLVLLLANGEQLVCACMPKALLDMSRAVMTERFSSPILPKPVLTFHFDRVSVASEDKLTKLQNVCDNGAVVVAAPTSLKSVLLKSVELLTQLDASRKVKLHS